MADLIGTLVAKNYQKVSPSSMFGTRELSFVKVVVTGADMTTQDGTTGTFDEADSLFSRAVRAIQGYVELFFLGTPDATSFVMAISGDTANDGEGETGLGVYGNIESDVAGALGLADGDVVLTELTSVGASIA